MVSIVTYIVALCVCQTRLTALHISKKKKKNRHKHIPEVYKDKNKEGVYRYILPLTISDFSGSLQVICFDDNAQILLKTTANNMQTCINLNQEKQVKETFNKALLSQWTFVVATKAQKRDVRNKK